MHNEIIGKEMYGLLKTLFPIYRSLAGEGNRETLKILQEHIPLDIKEVPTGTRAFDWTVPQEWNIKDAWVKNSNGEKIIDFKQNNLSVVGYSLPVNKVVNLAELNEHLHSLSEYPDAIPYITSYYKEYWGFCIEHEKREKLAEDNYTIFIDSEFKNGNMTYGELIIKGKEEEEILLSTNICHPQMANNELSGPVLTTYLAKWLLEKERRYTYRILFVPETIGAICYLSKNYKDMKQNTIAGFNLACAGDNGAYSWVGSKNEHTLADRLVENVMKSYQPSKHYSFLWRGSDERQYNANGIDLPVVCFSRSKFSTYAEYHTSKDNLDFVSAEGLEGSFNFMTECIGALENNYKYKTISLCEPQLGKRNLYPSLGTNKPYANRERNIISNLLAYADGENDLIDISNKIEASIKELLPVISKLIEHDLIKK